MLFLPVCSSSTRVVSLLSHVAIMWLTISVCVFALSVFTFVATISAAHFCMLSLLFSLLLITRFLVVSLSVVLLAATIMLFLLA